MTHCAFLVLLAFIPASSPLAFSPPLVLYQNRIRSVDRYKRINLQARTRSRVMRSKWDDLEDEDDQKEKGPLDMFYTLANIGRQNKNFVAMREAGGPSLTNDLYVRDPENDTFWFVGKTSRVSDISTVQAISRQWNLIEQHATRLRPIELFPKRGKLEIWFAPGDSELDVAYNRPNIIFTKVARPSDLGGNSDTSPSMVSSMVGFQGEMYEGGELGFRTWRKEDGTPAKPEIQPPDKGPKRAPTDSEMKEIEDVLKGKDLNEFF